MRLTSLDRPEYWGTFTKKATACSGCKPFQLETGVLDYEYDSEEDWEEEEDAESLSGSEKEEEVIDLDGAANADEYTFDVRSQ